MRSGGIFTRTGKRKKSSFLKRPCSTSSARFCEVEAATRTLTGFDLPPLPVACSFASISRTSFGCTAKGSAAISSKKMKPFCAPVKAPLLPNSSASALASVIIAQSTTWNGPCRRIECSCTARAASSLPVPVSPSISRFASSFAAARSSANTSRIACDWPTSSPKSSAPASSTSLPLEASFTASFVLPSPILSPGSTIAEPICRPSSQVPLRLPRSRRYSPRMVRSTSRCLRETVLSVSTRSFDVSEPTRISPSTLVAFLPLSGPATTSSAHSRTWTRLAASSCTVTVWVMSGDSRAMGGESVSPPRGGA